jgi:hypothetical protein
MKSWLFAPLFLSAMAGALFAQEPLITPDTPVNSGVLHNWLHSGDARLVTWAADFARRTHDANIVAEMPALLDHWTIPRAYENDESQAAQRRAATAVLDALIQENAQVPPSTINAVAEFFPAQATILISHLPLSESRETLEDWTYGAEGFPGGHTLARVASMMLAKEPGPSRGFWNGNFVGFATGVVGASEEELHITITSSGGRGSGTGSTACGDSMGRKTPAGWPQVYDYGLVENDPDAGAAIVVDLDGDRIAYTRVAENSGSGSCYFVEALDPTTRHRLIAHWLGVMDKDMSWQPVEASTILWTDKVAYEQKLGEITESQRQKLHATVEALHQRGFLTAGEAATVTPRLVVTVHCEIDPCPLN